MSTDFAIRLRNELSGPAEAAASSLEEVQRELKQTTAALDTLEQKQKTVARTLAKTSPGSRKAESPFSDQKTKVSKIFDASGGTRDDMRRGQLANIASARRGRSLRATSFAPVSASVPSAGAAMPGATGGGLGSMLGSGGATVAAITAIAAAVGMLVAKFGELTAAAGAWLVSTQIQREASLLSFKLMFGGINQASAAYEQAIGLSMKLGQSAEETISVFQSLGAQGMKTNDIETMVKSLADLKLVSPNIQADRAISAIGQIMSKGKLGMEELQGQLGDSANLNVGYVKDALAEILNIRGKTEADIRAKVDKMMQAGKIDSSTGVKAVQMAISRMAGGGKPGEAAMAANKSLGATLAQLANLPKNLGLTMQLPGTEPIIAFGQAVLKVLDVTQKPAKALQASVGGLFKSIVAAIGGELPGESGIEKLVYGIADAIDMVDTVVNNVAPVAKAMWGGMKEAFTETYDALGPLAAELGKVFGGQFASKGQLIAAVAKEMGKGLAYIVIAAGAVVAALTAVMGVVLGLGAAISAGILGTIAMVGTAVTSAIAIVSGFATEGFDAGMNIVDGVAQGITAGLAKVAEAAASIGSTAISAVTSTLTIRSPSRVMAKLGAHTAAGFAIGVDAHAPQVDAAMTSLVAPPDAAAAQPGGAGRSGGGSITININITGGKDSEELASELSRLLPAVLRDAFDQMGAEMGLA